MRSKRWSVRDRKLFGSLCALGSGSSSKSFLLYSFLSEGLIRTVLRLGDRMIQPRTPRQLISSTLSSTLAGFPKPNVLFPSLFKSFMRTQIMYLKQGSKAPRGSYLFLYKLVTTTNNGKTATTRAGKPLY